MSKNILNALPELVTEGLLSDDDAQKIRTYYKLKERQQPQLINIVFGIIGAVLVGLGIILMLAHNWDELGRPVKVVLAFLPLIIGQFFCGYALFKKQGSKTWIESSATFLFFAVGASISLVAQVYNISGDLAGFLFTWMLLCVPLIYIMPSSMVSLLFMVGITAYGTEDGYNRSMDSYHYWWMLLLAVPHYYLLLKNRPHSNFTFFHHWFFPLSLTICLGTLSAAADEYMVIAYMSLLGIFYLLGTSNIFLFKRIISNGYLIIGSLCTMGILLALSFKWFWEELDDEKMILSFTEIIAIIVSTATAIFLLYKNIQNRGAQPINPMGFIFALFILIFFIGLSSPDMGMILMNLLLLAAAIFTIQRGLLLNHLGILNYGLLIIATLVTCRFFDSKLSFVFRGLMFVMVGIGFFVANSQLIKKRKQHEQ